MLGSAQACRYHAHVSKEGAILVTNRARVAYAALCSLVWMMRRSALEDDACLHDTNKDSLMGCSNLYKTGSIA